MLLLKDQEFVLPPSLSSTTDDASKESMETLENRPGKSASEMLRNFCKWQRVFNDPDDASPLHHDTALLLTRFLPFFFYKLTLDLIRFIVLLFSLGTEKTFAAILRCKSVTLLDWLNLVLCATAPIRAQSFKITASAQPSPSLTNSDTCTVF
jgi:hypothetical protein